MKQALSLFLCFVLFAFVEMKLESPIALTDGSGEQFSGVNAMKHLEQIAAEPHYMGTHANEKVKEYLIKEFEKLGFQVEEYVGHTERFKRSNYVRYGRTENIIARLRGTGNTGTILLAAHYDSVLKAPGAADDGHAVASMLEAARLLAQKKHLNDIVFLLTDGEENGLLGAKAYTENHDLSEVGLILNYEARGNSGPCLAFEWSEGNAWLVRQVAKIYHRPVSSSLSFEIYKKMPNDTDFTFLKTSGSPGINHAFIDGFSYYHNPADNYENLNPNSLQHAGENMYRAALHFADQAFPEEIERTNASFFNFLGFLVLYPSWLDAIFLLMALVLLGYTLYRMKTTASLSIGGVALQFIKILGILVIAGAFGLILEKVVFALYPHYKVFYAGQFYNHTCYFFSALGAVLLLGHFTYRKANWSDIIHTRSAFCILLLLLSIGMYLAMPTAVYALVLPLLALIGVSLISTTREEEDSPFFSTLLLGMLPVVLWTPLVYNLFLAFSIDLLVAPTVFGGFLFLALFSLIPRLVTESIVILLSGLALMLGGFLWGHWTSQPTADRPLPISNEWLVDLSQDTSFFSTDNEDMYFGDIDWVAFAKKNKGAELADSKIRPTLKTAYEYCGQKISIDSNAVAHIKHKAECFDMLLTLRGPSNVRALQINDQSIVIPDTAKDYYLVEILGVARDSISFSLDKIDPSQAQEIVLETRFLGVPEKYYQVFKTQAQSSVTKLKREISL